MAHTFGEELKRFALSIDAADNEIGKEFYDLLFDYLERVLKMDYFHFMIDNGKFEGNPLLQVPEVGDSLWSSDNAHDSVRTLSEEEHSTYMAQSTYVYGTGKPIWVTAHGKPLNNAEEYQDAWSCSSELPNYYSPKKADVQTSIVVPLRTRQRIVGFMCLESTEELKFSEMAKSELERVAEAAGTVLSVRDTCKEHHQNTNAALKELKDLAREDWPSPLHHPMIFIASADAAAEDVMGAILETTNGFASMLKVVYWKDIDKSGNITKNIRKQIEECRFGICYFSERGAGPNNQQSSFCDNSNVLFEAGMMQALTGSPAGQPTAWIPIRELDSIPEKPPFDFAQENMITVKRLEDGKLNRPQFIDELRARIEAIIGIEY